MVRDIYKDEKQYANVAELSSVIAIAWRNTSSNFIQKLVFSIHKSCLMFCNSSVLKRRIILLVFNDFP